ncbi:MAG TPA: hypothetical protein VGB15_20050 [Longimicrobium sp.]
MSIASDDPAAVVRAAAAALEEERWEDVLAAVDQRELERTGEGILSYFRAMVTRSPRTADEILAERPYLPREVAAWEASSEANSIERGLPWMLREWGVHEPAELASLSAAELFIRWLKASSPAAVMRMAWATSPTPVVDPAAQAGAPPPVVRHTVYGAVEHGEEAFVVYRQAWVRPGQSMANDAAAGTLRVARVARTPEGWRLMLDQDFLGHHNHWITVWKAGNPPRPYG